MSLLTLTSRSWLVVKYSRTFRCIYLDTRSKIRMSSVWKLLFRLANMCLAFECDVDPRGLHGCAALTISLPTLRCDFATYVRFRTLLVRFRS